MKVSFQNKFRFSPDGHSVVEYAPGEHDVSEECARIARKAGVLKSAAPRKNKSA